MAKYVGKTHKRERIEKGKVLKMTKFQGNLAITSKWPNEMT